MCGTVYGDMHLKDLLGSFVRVGYHIPVPDFYLVLHGLRCRKSTIMDKSSINNHCSDKVELHVFGFGCLQEEYEDSQGNVVTKKTYDDLKRQGLL